MKRSIPGRRNPAEIEERTGYTFQDRSLLERALTRLAYTLEAGLPARSHMDALATLGDAVINVVVVEAVVMGGEPTRARSATGR